MNSEPPLVALSGLTKRFGRTTAVDAIDLNVRRGATLGLLGPNGAGKSSTLKMLLGMLRPTAGRIRVLGGEMPRGGPQLKQRIGYVPETPQIYRWMTVSRVLRFSKAMYLSWNDDLCGELLDMFQLPLQKKVKALSRGMLAKLSLLIALAHEPELIILDEPLSGLDPIARDEFIEGVLRGICGAERTVLFSSHQLDEVNRLADSVAIMNQGRIMVHCTIDQLMGATKRVRAVLPDGYLPDSIPDNTIWQRVNRREWLLTLYPFQENDLDTIRSQNRVESLGVSEMSLDDVFKDFIRGERTR